MELDTFILTVEDFLEGSITGEFLQEEINYTKEEVITKKNLLTDETFNEILSAIEEMMKYFTTDRDKEYIKRGYGKIKTVQKILKGEDTKTSVTEHGSEHLISSRSDYVISSGMKIGDENYDKEHQTDYSSDPVSSPLYNLIITYEELAAQKITIKDWIEQLIDSEEELYYLLEKTDEISGDIDTLDSYVELIQQALKLIEDLEIEYSEENISQEKSREIIEEIRLLNKDIYELQEKIFSEKDVYNIKDSIQEAYEKFQDEDYRTGNYILMEEMVQKYMDGTVKEEDFLHVIKKMRTVISGVEEQYENLPISQEELTLEVLRGDKLLTEGLMLWLEGLDMIEDSLFCDTEDKDMFLEGLRNIFAGNKRLVILQYFSEQIQRQVQLQKTFQEGMTEGGIGV